MGKLSAGQKRRQKDLKRKRKQAKANSKKPVFLPKSDLPNLSKSLLRFAEPLLEAANDRGSKEEAINLAVVCWNMGIVSPELAKETRENCIDPELSGGFSSEGDAEEFANMIDTLILSRRLFFWDDKRFIDDFEIDWPNSSLHLKTYGIAIPESEQNAFGEKDLFAGLSAGFEDRLQEMEKPLTEEQSKIIDQVNKGYEYLDNNQNHVKAADAWLEAWESVKSLYADEKSLTDISHIGDLFLAQWADELEVTLHNAGVSDPVYFEKRLEYCRDYCSRFPETDEDFIFAMRRGEAESYFLTGRSTEGDAAYQSLVSDFPDYTWGYISWGDMHNAALFHKDQTHIKTDYQKARELYQIPIDRGLVDAEDAQERLDSLEREYQKNTKVLEA